MKTPMYVELSKLCQSNPQFGKEFVANPKEAYEKHTKEAWPFEDIEVKAVLNEPRTLYITFPKPPGAMGDKDLMELAGGSTLGSASTTGSFLTTLGTASTAGSANPDHIPQIMVGVADSMNIDLGQGAAAATIADAEASNTREGGI